MEKFEPVAVACLGLLAALTCTGSEAELRSDLIESARTEKEANLTPERPPRVGAEDRVGRKQPGVQASDGPSGWNWRGIRNHRARLRLRHRTAV